MCLEDYQMFGGCVPNILKQTGAILASLEQLTVTCLDCPQSKPN